MTDTRIKRLVGPDHPITVAPFASRVIVHHGSAVLADSTRAVELREADYPAVFYIPLGDVDGDRLRTSELHTWCPYKGEASYYSVISTGDEDEAVLENSIWYYAEPSEAVAPIKDRLAFYADRFEIEIED